MPVHDWSKVPPNVFHNFHTMWLSELGKALNQGVLPVDHFAALEQYSVGAVPDILALRAKEEDQDDRFSSGNGTSTEIAAGAVAVTDAPPQVEVEMEADSFLPRQKQLAIRHSLGELVALVELVSPANKRTPKALEKFKEKVQSAIDQDIHVLVIDVLSPGPFDPQGMHGAIWQEFSSTDFVAPSGKPLTLASYRAGEVPKAYVQPLAVGDELPAMPIFLTFHRYVKAPLAATYDEAWNGSPRPWREMLTA